MSGKNPTIQVPTDLLANMAAYLRADGGEDAKPLIEHADRLLADGSMSRTQGGGVLPDRLAIRLLVEGGHVTEGKANEALSIAHGFIAGPLGPEDPRARIEAARIVELALEEAYDAGDDGTGFPFTERAYKVADAIPRQGASNSGLEKALRDVTAVAITMLYDSHREDVVVEFSLAELERIAAAGQALQPESVERVYRRAWNLLNDQHRSLADPAVAIPDAGRSGSAPQCWCQTCRPITLSDMRMVVCPTCGNKRCPHANDHRNTCTGSNEPGQKGSAYEHVAVPSASSGGEREREPTPEEAAWQFIASAFNNTTTSASERVLEGLRLPSDEAHRPLMWHVERAMACNTEENG